MLELDNIVHCPECLQPLSEDDGALVCTSCEARFPRADGIPVLASNASFYYKFAGLERNEMQEFLSSIDREGFASAVQSFFDGCDVPRAAAFYRNVFRAERAAWKLALSFPEGAHALDMGAGAGVVSMALSPHCERVVACDLTLERLAFLKRWAHHENAHNISLLCGGDGARLPFATDQFDLVILNGVLEWVASGRTGDPRQCQREFLDEVRRILKPSGQLYVGIENRVGYTYFFGKHEDHTGIRFLSLMPRALARVVHRWKCGTEYRVYTYSARGLTRLLEASGFDVVALHSPFPDYREFEELVALDGRNRATAPTRPSRLKSLLHQVACHPKVFRHMSPTFAAVAGTRASGTSLLADVAGALELEHAPRTVDHVTVSRTGMAIWRARRRDGVPVVVRLAVSPEGRSRCEANFATLTRLHGDASLSEKIRTYVPKPMGRTQVKGLLAAAETRLPGRAASRALLATAPRLWTSLVEVIREIDCIEPHEGTRAQVASKSPHEEWSRSIRRRLPQTDAGRRYDEVVQQVGAWLSKQPVPLAFAHGNCHVGNVLVDPQRSNHITGLFDWDLASTQQPRFIDLVEFAVGMRFKDPEDVDGFMKPLVPAYERTMAELTEEHGLPDAYTVILELLFLLRLAARHVRLPIVGPEQRLEMLRVVGILHRHAERSGILRTTGVS